MDKVQEEFGKVFHMPDWFQDDVTKGMKEIMGYASKKTGSDHPALDDLTPESVKSFEDWCENELPRSYGQYAMRALNALNELSWAKFRLTNNDAMKMENLRANFYENTITEVIKEENGLAERLKNVFG